MQQASTKLSVVLQTLKREIKERRLLDLRLAAAMEQEEGGRHASLHDSLTSLPNRTLFHDRLEHGIAQARRRNWALALMFIDLDGFKAVNDRYGHYVGDSALKTIAHRLRESTRSGDTVSRHGGDEFLYLAMDTGNEANTSFIADKLIQAIELPFDVTVRNVVTSLRLKASIGIAVFPKDGTEVEAMITNADRAMYRTKKKRCGYSFAQ